MAASKAHHESEKEWIKNELERQKTITFWPLGLSIVWGKDDRYWRLPKNKDDKKNSEAAELIQVSWLEVTGTADVEKGKKYQIGFELSLKPDAFGWNGCQVYIMAKVGKKGKYTWAKVSLKDQNQQPSLYPDSGGLEVEVASDAPDPKIYFGLYEVWSGKWKGGLVIHKAVVTQTS